MLKQAKNTTLKSIIHATPLLVIGFLSSFAFVFTAWASGISPADVIALANSARSKAGLTPLSANTELTIAAQAKAEDMLKNDYFAHTSPAGATPWSWIKQAGYQYKAAGENLAINFTDVAEEHSAWMKSPTHRANILNAEYQEIGVAVVSGKIDGKESVVTVELFGTPFYAVADRASAVPPAVQKAPAEIKGVETQAETSAPLSAVPNTEPVLDSTLNISSALPAENLASQENVKRMLIGKVTWLDLGFLALSALVAFSLTAPALVFLFQASLSLIAAIHAAKGKVAETIQASQNGQPSLLEPHLRI